MMRLFRDKKKDLTVSDMVLLAMLNFPNGAMGESKIHNFVYYLCQEDEFSDMMKEMDFKITDEKAYSARLHSAIEMNCKDMAGVDINNPSNTSVTNALFSDDLRFEFYGFVKKEEEYMAKVPGYKPRIIYLSSAGRAAATEALSMKLSAAQKAVISSIAQEV
jgi:hypothetical protein